MSARVRVRRNGRLMENVDSFLVFCYHLYIIDMAAWNKLRFDRCLKTSQKIYYFPSGK